MGASKRTAQKKEEAMDAQIELLQKVFGAFKPNHCFTADSFHELLEQRIGALSIGGVEGDAYGKGELCARYDCETQKVWFTLNEPVGIADDETRKHDFIPDHWKYRLFDAQTKIIAAAPDAEVYVLPACIFGLSNDKSRRRAMKSAEFPPSTPRAQKTAYDRLLRTTAEAAEKLMQIIHSEKAYRFDEYAYFFRQVLYHPLRAVSDFEEFFSDAAWHPSWSLHRSELTRLVSEVAFRVLEKLYICEKYDEMAFVWETIRDFGFWDEAVWQWADRLLTRTKRRIEEEIKVKDKESAIWLEITKKRLGVCGRFRCVPTQDSSGG